MLSVPASRLVIETARARLANSLTDTTVTPELIRSRCTAIAALDTMLAMVDRGVNPLRAFYQVTDALTPVLPDMEAAITHALDVDVRAEVQA
jgi:hypothetical protein